MEMKINPKVVKLQRQNRAWSQNHLAQTSGLSLRTVQRIEKTGSASLDSIQALASVFEIGVLELQAGAASKPPSMKRLNLRKVGLGAAVATAISAVGLLFTGPSLAEGVKLDYAISLERQNGIYHAVDAVRMGDELIAEGRSTTILLDQYKLEITPTVQDDGIQIMLAVKVFENVDGEYSLRAEPKVITANTVEATIRSASNSGNLLSVFLTPSIQ